MTIEELARQAGCTTRNIRNYQTLGLLPHPTILGRVGYYDEGHLGRLRLIGQLQAHGFSLAGIAQLVHAWEEGRTLADVLGFEQALTAPWSDEEPVLMRAEELLELFPEAAEDPALAARSVQIGLIAPEGDMVRVHSPRLLRIGAELVASGVPLAATLDELVLLRSDLDRVAQRFVAMFDRHVWAPFAAAGMPSDQLPKVTEALRRMRPLAAASVEVILAQAMDRRTAENTAVRAAVGAMAHVTGPPLVQPTEPTPTTRKGTPA
jgi:DNA-binding transcriptional MerR regulator